MILSLVCCMNAAVFEHGDVLPIRFYYAELNNIEAEQFSERGPDRKVNVHLTSSNI